MCYSYSYTAVLHGLLHAQVMEKLLKDGNTMVLGSAVAAFTEVCFLKRTLPAGCG